MYERTPKTIQELKEYINPDFLAKGGSVGGRGYAKEAIKPIGTYSVYALLDGFDEAKQDYDQVYYKTDDYDEIIYYIADLKNEGEYTKDMQLIELMPNGKMRKFNSSMLAKGGRLKSALMRDRKYVSNEEWEKRYSKGTNRPRYKKRHAKGGKVKMYKKSK